jgi:CDP-glycerol glycerophosphotransferase (TagB/SpsB family)
LCYGWAKRQSGKAAKRQSGKAAKRQSGKAAKRQEDVWGTFGCERIVLMVARSLTSTIRLLDAVELFRGDYRVRFRFTVNDTSPFTGGVRELLRAADVGTIVPWRGINTILYHLALSASENIDFDNLKSHTIVLPHGLGFNKYVPTSDASAVRLAGLPPDDVLREGKATVVLSHPEQRAQLSATCPASQGHTVVTGDVMFDRLLASTPFRERYRAALRTNDRVLVMVASTWRPSSALGHDRSLLRRLLGELPADQYQVCAALHPNIWAWYGRVQILLWLAAEVDSGLILLPPEHGWQSALIAADQVVTDHGSLGLFAAAIDRPIVLTGGVDEVVPGTPVAELAETATRLDLRRELRQQLDDARNAHRAGAFTAVTRRVFAHVGQAPTRLRDMIYDKLLLAPPAQPPALIRIPDLPDMARRVSSFAVRTSVASRDRLLLVRFPAATWPGASGVDMHIVSEDSETDLRIRERAAVLTSDADRRTSSDADRWARSALNQHPGARLAAAKIVGGCAVRIRGGARVTVQARATDDVALLASAVYCCVLSGDLTDRTLIVRAGTTVVPVTMVVDHRGHEGGP